MVDARVAPHLPRIKRMCQELDKRIRCATKIEPYYSGISRDGLQGLPPAVTEGRLTKVYRNLMPVSDGPWGAVVVGAKKDRLRVDGLRDQEAEANAKAVWREWQKNELDSESKLAHDATLLNGRAFGTVWPDGNGGATVNYDDCTSMVVEYTEGPVRAAAAALRRWHDGDRQYATLYLPDATYKFQGPPQSANSATVEEWEPREPANEDWPLPNALAPFVPVGELAVNRRLKDWQFGYARGDFEHCLGVIDRINLLTFLGLVVAFWMGFPMRGVIGEKIRKKVLVDDDGHPLLDDEGKERTENIPILQAKADTIFQLTNPEAKIAEFSAADRKNLAVFAEFGQLATITSTPRHYFPMEAGISNISAETVLAFSGGLHAAVDEHKGSLGGGHLNIARLIGQAIGKPLSPLAQITWAPHEARSLAEKADAASKLKDGLPWQAIAEIVGLGSMDDINRWTAGQAQGPLNQLMIAAATNGNGQPGVPVG